jgi:hypothetical protein
MEISVQNRRNTPPLVAIGGLGGSGTRIVAEVLQRLGFYLGPELNSSLDNLLFTLLFKRPSWLYDFPAPLDIADMLEVFYGATMQGPRPYFEAYGLEKIAAIFSEFDTCELPHGIDRRNFSQLAQSMQTPRHPLRGIAWKEPNSHIYLPHIAEKFPTLKYIHVIRNGLDMALSRNRQQLINWGEHLDVIPKAGESRSQSQLRFWCVANQRTIDFGKEHMPERFYVLDYDALCMEFEAELSKLMAFLGCSLPEDEISALKGGINPASIGRFRAAPEGTFSNQDRAAVASFGFQTV